jgi:hypothetical protein
VARVVERGVLVGLREMADFERESAKQAMELAKEIESVREGAVPVKVER